MSSDTRQIGLFEPAISPLYSTSFEQQRKRGYYKKSALFAERQAKRPHELRQYARDMPIPTNTHVLAYLAGIVDGEGCISIYGHTKGDTRNLRLTLAIAMQHRPVLELFVETFGGPIYLQHKNMKVHQTPYWRTVYMSDRAAQVLSYLRPYLRIKADQADLAIAFQSSRIRKKGLHHVLSQSYFDDALAMKEKMSELNHRDSVSLRRLIQGSTEFTADTPSTVIPLVV